jgi:hypothetical protein
MAQPILPEPFMGLKKSNGVAQMLLPNIVSSFAWETNGNFSPDGTTLLYSTNFINAGTTIILMTLKNGKWTPPEIAPFSGVYPDIDPIFSPDGTRIYFTSRRPIDKSQPDKRDTNLWYVEVLDNGYGVPKQVSLAINTDENQYYNSVSNKGTIYFHASDSISNNIFMAVWNGKGYQVEPVPSIINSNYTETDPFISPNEDYLIFSSDRPGGYGGSDLYISFFKKGTWGQPINLGSEINSMNNDFAPCVSSGILTFTSGRMIEPWSSNHKKNFKTLMSKINGPDNQSDNIWYLKLDVSKFDK